MNETGTADLGSARTAGRFAPAIRPLTFATLVVLILAGIGLAGRYAAGEEPGVVYAALGLFFSINLLVCFWEACLFFRRSRVEAREEYWRQRWLETGRTPAVEFFTTGVPWARILSPTVWADMWAAYAQYDPCYADRRSYGFSVDVANGFVTVLPTLLLYASFASEFMPARLAGMLGLMLFWQFFVGTVIYWASFFVGNLQARISRRDLYVYIAGASAPWALFSLLGLWVSFRLVVDGNYGVLG